MRICLFKPQSIKDCLVFYKQIAQGHINRFNLNVATHWLTPHDIKYNCTPQEEWKDGMTRCSIFGFLLKTISLFSHVLKNKIWMASIFFRVCFQSLL